MCRTELDYVYPDRSWVMYTNDTYSPEGHLLERRHRNPEGPHWSILCRYDDHGRILEKEQAVEGSGRPELFSYRYDPLGRLDREVLNSGREGERVVESVRYDADGTTARTSYPAALDDTTRSTRGVSGESMLQTSIDTVVVMTILDARDRPVRRVFYNTDDRVIGRVGFRYDARGWLVEEGELVGGRVLDDFRNLYRYDAAGRRIEADRRWGDLGGERRTFAYNDHGDMVEETIEQDRGLLSEIDPPQAWTRRFTFQYDEAGNWIGHLTY